MNGQLTRDLVWWRVHQWVPAGARILTAGLVGAVSTAIMLGLADRLAQLMEHGRTIDFLNGLTQWAILGAILGVIGGVAAGLASERREPTAQRTGRSPWSPLTARFNPAIGLAAGLGVGIVVGFTLAERFGFAQAFPVGLGGFLVSSVVAGLASGNTPPRGQPPSPHHGRFPGSRFTAGFNPAVGLATGLPAGLSVGYAYGFVYGLPTGITFSIAYGLLDGLTQGTISAAIPAAPQASWRQNRAHARSVGVAFGLTLGLTCGVLAGLRTAAKYGPLAGLVMGAMWGITASVGAALAAWLAVSETWRTTLAFLQLQHRGLAPRHGMQFLDDAHKHDVLRTAGPIYQFRHARLQDQLANQYQRDHDREPDQPTARSSDAGVLGVARDEVHT